MTEAEAAARRARVEEEARDLEHRRQERAERAERERIEEERLASERLARIRSELMTIETVIEDDFISASLPGTALPKRAILTALHTWLREGGVSTRKLKSSSSSRAWDVTMELSHSTVELVFERDEDGDWSVSYTSPVHRSLGKKSPEDEVNLLLEVAMIVEGVYLTIDPQVVGIDPD